MIGFGYHCLDKPREDQSDTSDLDKCGSFWIRNRALK